MTAYADDPFRNAASTLEGPAGDAFAVTPHDTNNFSVAARALYVGVAGNVVVVMASGVAVTFVGVPAGALLPIRCTRVNSTNTTASSIVGLV